MSKINALQLGTLQKNTLKIHSNSKFTAYN